MNEVNERLKEALPKKDLVAAIVAQGILEGAKMALDEERNAEKDFFKLTNIYTKENQI